MTDPALPPEAELEEAAAQLYARIANSGHDYFVVAGGDAYLDRHPEEVVRAEDPAVVLWMLDHGYATAHVPDPEEVVPRDELGDLTHYYRLRDLAEAVSCLDHPRAIFRPVVPVYGRRRPQPTPAPAPTGGDAVEPVSEAEKRVRESSRFPLVQLSRVYGDKALMRKLNEAAGNGPVLDRWQTLRDLREPRFDDHPVIKRVRVRGVWFASVESIACVLMGWHVKNKQQPAPEGKVQAVEAVLVEAGVPRRS